MIKLRTQLTALLKTIHPRVYSENASDKTAYPYLVYDLPNSTDNEEQELFLLDVDVWDDKTDTTEIEILASKVWATLHKFTHIDADMQFSINRMTRGTLKDEDPRIKRRKLTFEVRYFNRKLYE